MHLYNLTILPPSAITCATVGSFSGTRQQDICICRGGTRLELIRPDASTGKLTSIVTSDAFGTIRSLTSFRLTGGNKDYIILGSDSGRIVVVEFDQNLNAFVKLHQETYGKSGSRRVVPGQYLATDPKGRAVMIAAMEKSKLVYILNRDSAANLTISSPLEAHKSSAIIHDIVGVDVGFENPLFAALEVDYSEADQDPTGEVFNLTEKVLTYYELDLGLNHVVRKWSEATEPRANMLLQVPGGQSATNADKFDGPSGVLVCSEDMIIYKHQNVKEHRIPIPKRSTPYNDPERGVIIVAAVMHKMRGAFFFLLQTEEGDLFKVTIDHEDEEVQALKIKYFDTVPVASSLTILKSGFLFVAAEMGNHYLYQFEKLGDDDDEQEFSSAQYPDFGASPDSLKPAFFSPRPLENLVLSDELESLAPITSAKVANLLNTDSPQILTSCGRGSHSTLKMLRHGLDVSEIVTSDLPGPPTNVWTTKLKDDDAFDRYIILGFLNATLVLSIGETIVEVSDTGFLTNSPTISIQQLDKNGLLQIHPTGIRHIHLDGGITEWKVPAGRKIVVSTSNRRQVVVGLSGGELIYFELDLDGQLNEYQEQKEMGSAITTLSLSEVPKGRQRTPFLAIGLENLTVQIISLDPNSVLETISLQALTAVPSSICIAELLDSSIDKSNETLFVNIGLSNGVLLRTVLDSVNGQLTDTRTRFLGSRPVKLLRVKVDSKSSVIALSSRTWLNYTFQNMLHFNPLIYDSIDNVHSFSAELCPEGLIGVVGSSLRIFTIPKLGVKVKQDSMPLSYTPRKMILDPATKNVITIESEHGTVSPSEKAERLAQHRAEGLDFDDEALNEEIVGVPRADAGKWASCIRIANPLEKVTLSKVDLDDNECATSVAIVSFANQEGNLPVLVVGTAKDAFVQPRTCKNGFLRVYKFINEGKEIELVHKTEIDDIPSALIGFQGKLAAGIGKALRIFDLGKKKLLRKVENKSFSTAISTLSTQGFRILVGDMQDSISYAVYKPVENRLLVFADDIAPRWTTCSTMVDYDTAAGGDKFGNLWICRLPKNVSDEVDEDPTGSAIMHEKGYLMGAPHKVKNLVHININDIPTSIEKASLVPGGREVLLYTGILGTVGILIPFLSKEDVDFFQTLEMHMRTEFPSLVGRDHLAYRGYYFPVRNCVDGDLCESFALLPMAKQQQVAAELDRSVSDVLKKIEALRVSSGY
ncbi:CPSF A subunit region-domain-containing protein [Phakopsora pachyrhizi]|uniref:Pre-mRNA-splicing factor RSE1 n=1 Tax=Phakopsora pachyrhizi TaxID=170000 RepID=A0AAV0AJA9_PHAPC|nr:CPSF A subunit region-domain-containing protein [Phakopsora pachyrhizi]CAH7667624.1 CPSF A subunit region-domain-containing protein [Phakopsora pachyrhizi]